MRGRRVWDVDRLQAELNVLGGAAFSAGSLLLFDRALSRWGVVLFVLGSFAMLFGALAAWRTRYGRRPSPRSERREDGSTVAASVTVAPVVPAPVVPAPLTPTELEAPATTSAPTSTANALAAPVLTRTSTRSRHSA